MVLGIVRNTARQSVPGVGKGALRMNLWVRRLRGLCLVGMVLAGAVSCTALGAVATAGYASAQSAGAIVVEGNRRVEADTIRSYFRLNPGERLDSYKIDQALKALYATGLFQDVRINPARGPAGRHGDRKSGNQPGRVRRQFEAQGRPAFQRSAVEASRHAVASDRAGRRSAHR